MRAKGLFQWHEKTHIFITPGVRILQPTVCARLLCYAAEKEIRTHRRPAGPLGAPDSCHCADAAAQ